MPVIIFASVFIVNSPLIIISSEIGSAKNLYLNKLEFCILQITYLKILKFDIEIYFDEADTIYIFFQKAASVPVLYIYNIYKIGKINYIIMKYISEPILKNCWNTLLTAEKNFLKMQLRQYISFWR
jgi:hypothetical protein